MNNQATPSQSTASTRFTEAAVLYGPQDIRVEHIPLSAVGPGQTLVEMSSGGICGSDMHYFADGRNGSNVLRQPTVLGHEGAGTVLMGGPGTTIGAGTAVAIEPAVPCGSCSTCQAGRYNVCPAGVCFGSPPTNGLFARHVIVPEHSLHPLPKEIPPEVGAVIEPLAVAVWAVERAQIEAGQRVLITGAGPIGLLIAQVVAATSAGEIIVTDVTGDRLRAAAASGATQTINTAEEQLDLSGVDRLIECSGNTSALIRGIQTLRPASRATVVGQAGTSIDGLPLAFLQRFEIDLVTAFRYANAFPKAIELARTGQVDLRSVVTSTFRLQDVAEALTAPSRDTRNLKVLVTYD